MLVNSSRERGGRRENESRWASGSTRLRRTRSSCAETLVTTEPVHGSWTRLIKLEGFSLYHGTVGRRPWNGIRQRARLGIDPIDREFDDQGRGRGRHGLRRQGGRTARNLIAGVRPRHVLPPVAERANRNIVTARGRVDEHVLTVERRSPRLTRIRDCLARISVKAGWRKAAGVRLRSCIGLFVVVVSRIAGCEQYETCKEQSCR